MILAHLYQIPEIQEIADYVGDSYYLSQVARDAKEDLIIFCGVKFMAESAKVLSPEKTVILPAPNAGCPMADMAEVEDVEEMIKKYPDAFKVCYINSSYEVKALCDASVTSSSALNIIKNIPNKQILFLPDQNLGGYISEFFPEKEFILWRGFCPTHHRITAEDIIKAKEEHPNVKVLSHPECSKEVRDLSDYIGSTSGIINYATECEDKEFIIATEEGVLHQLKKKNPDKKFYFPEVMVCPNMKKTSLQDVYDALDGKKEEVILDEEIRKKALTSLENMHKLGN
ncbi:quinolinate synthase NadA [Intestinibacter bartlettii]|uniref:quinolinate synthase NadA n=1 Tax=Intestinibacter bartlettii TaxID=261299 RepID=UPI0039921C22